MKKIAFLFFAWMALSLPALAQLKVSNNPVGAAVVITQPSAVAVTWSVSGTSAGSTVVSEEGLFVLNGETLGRVGTFLTTDAGAGGSASVTETLLIPPDVVNRAYKRNAATFFYRRQFRSTADGAAGQSELTCRVATSAYGNFSIAGLTIYFDNQRGETTFEQNDTNAHAFAEVHYNGSGLLKGTWEVQEPNSPGFRVLQQVNYHLAYGDRIVFQSPSVPPLPTVVTGLHNVRFTVTQPVSGFPLPQVTYFVKLRPEEEKAQAPLRAATPDMNSTLQNDVAFRWTGKVEKASILKFSVSERASTSQSTENPIPVSPSSESLPDSSPLAGSKLLHSPDILTLRGVEVFSAALPSGAQQYSPRAEQLKRLRPATIYVWQVQALDSTGVVLAETELRTFQVTATQSQP